MAQGLHFVASCILSLYTSRFCVVWCSDKFIYLISDVECLCSGIDDELMVGRYDTGVVDDSQ